MEIRTIYVAEVQTYSDVQHKYERDSFVICETFDLEEARKGVDYDTWHVTKNELAKRRYYITGYDCPVMDGESAKDAMHRLWMDDELDNDKMQVFYEDLFEEEEEEDEYEEEEEDEND